MSELELNGHRHDHDVVAASTLAAAEHLVQQNDPQRLRAWLAKHSTAERVAIWRHLQKRTGQC